MKKPFTIGASVAVFHHSEGLVGTLKKVSGHFMPLDSIIKRPAVELPPQISLQKQAVLDSAELNNWKQVEARLVTLMKLDEAAKGKRKRERKGETKVETDGVDEQVPRWVMNGYQRGKQRYQCTGCQR
jgi:hypothetical protein